MADDDNKVNLGTVRRLMLEQLVALRKAPLGDALAQELRRSKGVGELGAVLIDSGRAEVEFLTATGQDGSGFLGVADGAGADAGAPRLTTITTGLSNGIASITKHRMGK